MFSDIFSRVEFRFNHFQSVIHDQSARVSAISAVDKEVGAAVQLLCSLRNALAPISLLPPKVLSRVFHFLSLEERPYSGQQKLGWIRATHLCSFWRQVALGDSSLWARISGIPTNLELISEMLVRARNAPLDIDIDLDGTPRPEALLLMFPPHLSHTRRLRLYCLSKLHSDSFRGICRQEAPTLEYFQLGDPVTSPITFRELGGTTLFNGRAPKLRTFSLSQVFIPWSLIPRGQLTQLEISLDDEVHISVAHLHGDLIQLIDLLANCPKLEVLVLGRCLPSQLSQSRRFRIIHLPRLSRLSLVGSSSRVANLFNMLEIPSSVTLRLRCISEDSSTRNDHLLPPAVSAHLQGLPCVEFKTFSVTLSYMDHSLHVTASTSLPTSRISQSRNDEFVLSFDGLPELGRWTDLIGRVCKVLPISNLEFLSISAPDAVDPVNWSELFKRCTKVTTMQAIGCGASSLVRALATPKLTNTNTRRGGGKEKDAGPKNKDNTPAQLARTPRSTTSYAHEPIFPKLTFLSLKGLNFAQSKHPSSILFDVVQKSLQQRRAAHRAPLKVLRIDSCAISAKRAKALEKLVEKFLWDEKERLVDEYEDFYDPWPRWEECFDDTT